MKEYALFYGDKLLRSFSSAEDAYASRNDFVIAYGNVCLAMRDISPWRIIDDPEDNPNIEDSLVEGKRGFVYVIYEGSYCQSDRYIVNREHLVKGNIMLNLGPRTVCCGIRKDNSVVPHGVQGYREPRWWFDTKEEMLAKYGSLVHIGINNIEAENASSCDELNIVVRKHFSDSPYGRSLANGCHSAESLRELLLVPALSSYRRVRVDIAIHGGYSSAFLEEAFGGLVSQNSISPEYLKEALEIYSSDIHGKAFVDCAVRHIENAVPRRCTHPLFFSQKILYHVTSRDNVSAILKDGLKRCHGEHKSEFISLSTNSKSWMKDGLVLLEVDIEGLSCDIRTFLPELDEVTVWGDIEPSRIRLSTSADKTYDHE